MTEGFQQYTVGEMSAMLSMASPTIRFYDASGAVVPRRAEENQYRRYTVVDANYLMKLKELRNVGVQVSEAAFLVNKATLAQLIGGYESIAAEAQMRLRRESLLIHGLERRLAAMRTVSTELEKSSIVQRPGLWRFNNQVEDKLLSGKERNKARLQWTDGLPVTFLSFRFQEGDTPALEWGYAVEEDYAELLGLTTSPLSEYYAPKTCVRYVFVSKSQVFLRFEKLKPALSFLEKHAFARDGDIIGRSIARALNENHEVIHYYEAWIPIQEM